MSVVPIQYSVPNNLIINKLFPFKIIKIFYFTLAVLPVLYMRLSFAVE